ncbi:MAG: histidine triad nucleotide-binding protein [Clostridia bacterium]|nr:histidine triad nucleotide-binding protein [Clostridia bacterium]
MENCIFCKIIKGEIPSVKLYENDEMIIIKDVAPQAPVHYLMIPKVHFKTIDEMNKEQSEILGRCFYTLGGLKEKLGLENGYRLIMNQGADACQTVPHLHVHILAGKKMEEKMC